MTNKRNIVIPESRVVEDKIARIHTDVDSDFCTTNGVTPPNDEENSRVVQLFTTEVNNGAFNFTKDLFVP